MGVEEQSIMMSFLHTRNESKEQHFYPIHGFE